MISHESKHNTTILKKKKMLSVWFKWNHKWASYHLSAVPSEQQVSEGGGEQGEEAPSKLER